MPDGRVINPVGTVEALLRRQEVRTLAMYNTIASLLDIYHKSKHDPFFWVSNILIVAMGCVIVYNLWNNNKK
jgi:hypothetical protein